MDQRKEFLIRIQAAADEVLGEEAPRIHEAMELGDETIDSLDLVEILMVIEDQEGFLIDAEHVSDVTNIGGLIDVLLERRTAEIA